MSTQIPEQQTYTESFAHCNFVRIPAVQHGFATDHLYISVFDHAGPDALPLTPGVVRISPSTYTVEIIFNTMEWDTTAQRFLEVLLPPQSGIVRIHASLPSLIQL